MGLFSSQDDVAKKVAKRLGVAWPPVYWAKFKTPTTGAFKVVVLLITKDEVVYGNRRLPLTGARATVDTSGNTAVAQGWVVKERADSRQVHLTIEGRGEPIVIRMAPDHESTARSSAAKINSLAGNTAAASAAPTNTPIPDQIRQLADLRDQGILTEEEFDAKKAELLSRL
jgi:hypothetical protein